MPRRKRGMEIFMAKWWQAETAYQIWPKSFYDSDGDGIGDLRGIIQKLDYLSGLGIGILWISPVYCSPLADEGYDISDYYNIDPRFGTMEDFDELLAKARKRDIHIIMDLVVSHCSDEHEWFRKACDDPDGAYGKYFYIRDWDGEHLPTNWRSYFGGPVWEPLPGHPDKVYLHSFHKKQPDLNWENPALRQEIYKMMNWWLDKGISGFRLDAIINIKKAFPFRDYPPDRDDGLSSITNMLADQKGIGEFLTEMRDATFAKHDSFSVGEVFDFKSDELPAWIGENGYFSSMFDFSGEIAALSPKGWYASKPFLTPDEYKKCIFTSQKNCGDTGFLSNIIENHDEPRGVNRYLPQDVYSCGSDNAKKLLAGTYFLLRGIPFIYQGQELGMENITIDSEGQIDDVSTRDELKVAKDAGLSDEEALAAVAPFSRDNARTPVQWDDSENAGFTSGSPWMRVNPNYKVINAAAEENNPDSVLSFYRKLIAIRKGETYWDVLTNGEFLPYLDDQHNLISYFRWNGIRTLLILGNFQPECMNVHLPEKYSKYIPVLTNWSSAHIYENTITLTGWQFVVLDVR